MELAELERHAVKLCVAYPELLPKLEGVPLRDKRARGVLDKSLEIIAADGVDALAAGLDASGVYPIQQQIDDQGHEVAFPSLEIVKRINAIRSAQRAEDVERVERSLRVYQENPDDAKTLEGLSSTIERLRGDGEQGQNGSKGKSPLDKLRGSSISTAEKIAERRAAEKDARWVLWRLALLSQATVFYSSPNTGKTLLVLWLLCEAIKREAESDLQIFYLNADDDFRGGTDKAELIAGSGIQMVIPGQGGENAFELNDFALLINEIIKKNEAQGFVMILDTLKKFTSLMDKEKAAAFGKLARAFVQAGGTLICLAHTNKHKDSGGKSIYEGSGDIVSDFDAAYTIEMDTARESADRQVTFENIKSRGPNALKVSFRYDAGEGRTWGKRFESVRRVEDQEARETVDLHHAEEQLKRDRDCVEYLTGKIRGAGTISRRGLIRDDLGNGFSSGDRQRTLDKYDEKNPRPEHRFWRTFENQTGGKSYGIITR